MKKSSIREQRKSRKAELKDKYRENAANRKEAETIVIEDVNTSVVSTAIPMKTENEVKEDIESRDKQIATYKIICELKQTKEEKKVGKTAKRIVLGTYVDEQMRDRAYEALKKSISSKHEVKDAVGENEDRCFIIIGVDQYFESFRHKIYKHDDYIAVNVLDRNRISRLFDIEV